MAPQTNRVCFFIDGFNLYHALESNSSYHKYKWLNLAALAKCFVSSRDRIVDVLYFTAYTPWNNDKLARHQLYVKALQFADVKVVLGAFRRVDQICQLCHKTYQTFREKRTDVNIAVRLFQTAVSDIWDTAMIISGDSDLIPAIEGVKKAFPAKRIGILIPTSRRAEELKQAADFHSKIKPKHLETCQFAETITLDKGNVLSRPASWK
ncbi:MAG: NYN domain-containing protein [Planctomycetota bacterium]